MNWRAATAAKPRRIACVSALALAATVFAPVSHADTVASLLGNFTINQYCGVRLSDESLQVHYVVVFGQLPALRELHLADVNGDGVTSQTERDEYVRRLAPGFASKLKVAVDGVAVPLHVTRSSSSLPTEQGGFSLRLDVDFSGNLLPAGAAGIHKLSFANRLYEDRIGWREIAIQSDAPIQIFNTEAYASSLTAGLTEAVKALPATGPLDERSVQVSFTRGALPPGARPIGLRPGSSVAPSAGTSVAGTKDAEWLQMQTRRLVNLISTQNVAPHIAVLALLTALVLGALHALSPGHGKTIVAAYLIGSRGTPKHAAFLGLTVTITHTLGVFALGFATLFASRFIVPERLFPILSLGSGLLIFGMGIVLIAQRWRGARLAMSQSRARNLIGRSQPTDTPEQHSFTAHGAHSTQAHADHHAHLQAHPHSHSGDHGHGHPHRHGHPHGHEHGHGHGHVDEPGRAAAVTHSHGGSVHSHLPPGADEAPVTWRSLLALGISGGLIPCPSAMVLLLAAVALNRTGYGLLLVLAFSVGLAITLTVIGLAFLYARNHLRIFPSTARWPHLLPVLSAGIITVVGAVLCLSALQSAHF